MLLLLALACTSTPPGDSGAAARACAADLPPLGGGRFVVSSDTAPQVFLSGFSDGQHAVLAGGGPTGTEGVLGFVDGPDAACLERSVTPGPLWWVTGTGPADFWAVGANGIVVRQTATGRERLDLPEPITLYGIQVRGDQAWVVGGDVDADLGALWHWDGAGWTEVLDTVPGVLFKIDGDVAVGSGVSVRREESGWSVHLTETHLVTVRQQGDEHWAVGGTQHPVLVRGDGASWSAIPLPETVDQALSGLWTTGETVWVGGNYGVTAGWDGTEWVQPWPPVTADVLHGVFEHCGEVWFVGGSLYSTEETRGTVVRWGADPTPLDWPDCATD